MFILAYIYITYYSVAVAGPELPSPSVSRTVVTQAPRVDLEWWSRRTNACMQHRLNPPPRPFILAGHARVALVVPLDCFNPLIFFLPCTGHKSTCKKHRTTTAS